MGHLHRLIAFDLDGTLVDSSRDLADSANDLIQALGGTPLTVDAIVTMVGEGAGKLVERALDAAHLPAPPGALERFLAFYDQRLLNHTRLYDGVIDVVRHARAHGRVVVVTNKPVAPSERILRALQVRDLFDAVLGGDGPLPRKPDPAALLGLMAEAGATPDRTILVGDSPTDYETAVRAKTHCCLVSYGFGFAKFPAGALQEGTWIAADVAGLAAIIDEFVSRDF